MGKKLFRRWLAEPLGRAMRDTPIVVVLGARQVGKSTLARELVATRDAYVTLDDLTVRAAASADPAGFLAAQQLPVVLDEVQHVPELFRQLKLRVDEDRLSGSFVLTGSANVLLLPRIGESLAGRSEYFTLWPLSQGELAGSRERFVDAMFGTRLAPHTERTDVRRDVIRRALRGGYPEVVLRADEPRRSAWFRAYLTAIIQRDVRDISNIDRPGDLALLLRTIAARVGSPLNVLDVSRTLGIPHMTVRRHLAILERLFLVHQLPGWSGGLNSRIAQRPKAYVVDSGLHAHLMGVDLARFDRDPVLAGALLENFVVGEIARQLGWSATRATLHHFRAATTEVDLVLERSDGSVVGVEVKASGSVNAGDLGGLRALAARAGKKFHRGVLLYTGTKTVPFAENVHAMPISVIWRS